MNCENKPRRRQQPTQGGASYKPTVWYFWNILWNILQKQRKIWQMHQTALTIIFTKTKYMI